VTRAACLALAWLNYTATPHVWHSVSPASAAPVSYELCCKAGVLIIEVRLNLDVSLPTALAEGSGENPVYKLAVVTFRCLHGIAPPHLADEFLWSSDLEARSRLSSLSVIIITDRPSYTVVDCRRPSFFGRTARVLNELPRHVTYAPSPLRVFWHSSEDSSF